MPAQEGDHKGSPLHTPNYCKIPFCDEQTPNQLIGGFFLFAIVADGFLQEGVRLHILYFNDFYADLNAIYRNAKVVIEGLRMTGGVEGSAAAAGNDVIHAVTHLLGIGVDMSGKDVRYRVFLHQGHKFIVTLTQNVIAAIGIKGRIV